MPYFTYILSSQKHGTLYVGSTNDLIRRVYEHRSKAIPGFTLRYGVVKLVHFEIFEIYEQAAQREKRLKKWKRAWKISLIEEKNPHWQDLYDSLSV